MGGGGGERWGSGGGQGSELLSYLGDCHSFLKQPLKPLVKLCFMAVHFKRTEFCFVGGADLNL